LSEPFDELDAARDLIAATHASLTLAGHSTGGLTAALWASRRAGQLDALVLNSPWIAFWGAPGYGRALLPAMGVLSRRDPLTEIKLPDSGDRYARCVHASGHGEWDYDFGLKSPGGVPIRAGWLRAVLRGHRAVDSGLGIEAPVFMAASTRSYLTASGYSERARTSDIVLDADALAAAAHRLGRRVTVVRVTDGFHDLSLSVPHARASYFAELGRWLDAYVPHPAGQSSASAPDAARTALAP
jgi:alpha-beta hydrolase superfamily lysophospholipase